MGSDDRWYADFFDERYLAFYPQLLELEVSTADACFVAEALGLDDGAAVLDLGCGTGRHAIALAEMGMRVTGVDLSAVLLERAKGVAHRNRVEVEWQKRDMRDLDGLGPFSACASLFTAFGFFGDDEDQKVLDAIAGVLAPGGKLLIDLTNHLLVLATMAKGHAEHWYENKAAVVCERNDYDAASGMLITHRVCHFKDKAGSLELPPSRVRAYSPHEMRRMLTRAGFAVDRVYGELANTPFHWATSPNQVFLARKS